MPFNPDEYLAKTSPRGAGEFDPNAYLAAKSAAPGPGTAPAHAWLGFKEPLKAGFEAAKGAIGEMGESAQAYKRGEISYLERLLRSGSGALNLVIGAPAATAMKAVTQGVQRATGGAAGRVAENIARPIAESKPAQAVGKFMQTRAGKDIGAAANIGLMGYPAAKAILPVTEKLASAAKAGVSAALKKAAISTEKRALGLSPTQMERLTRKGITPELIFKEKLGVSVKKMPEKIAKLETKLENQLQEKIAGVSQKIDAAPIIETVGKDIEKSINSVAGGAYSGAEEKALKALGKIEKWLFSKSDAGTLTAAEANAIKRDLYKQSKPIFNALARGNPVLPGMQVEAQLKKDIAKGLKEGIERASGSKEIKVLNQRIGNLIEIEPMVKRSAVKLQGRQLPGRLGLYEILTGVGAGLGVAGAKGGVGKGLAAAGTAAVLTTIPRSSTVAHGLYKAGQLFEPGLAKKAAFQVGKKTGKILEPLQRRGRRGGDWGRWE